MRRVAGWVKPRNGYVKLNIDVGLDMGTLEGPVGAVLRDHNWKFIVAANAEVDICFDPFTGEAIVVRFDMNLASDVCKLLGIEDIVKKALDVDKTGDAIIEHLLCMMEHAIHILGLPKLRETAATAAWYLWYERRKFTNGEETQSAAQINLIVRGFATNFIIPCSPKPMRRVAG